MALDIIKNGNVIPNPKREEISKRYKRITRAINREFWDSESDTDHTLYVGSYGRGTAIVGSDLDVLASLPKEEYERFDAYKGNGQSRLLQAAKDALKISYPLSNIRADGQIVKISFSDGMEFEILPAFENWDGSFQYPDSNQGGKWRSTHPKAERNAIRQKNEYSNGLLIDTCQSMRSLRNKVLANYTLSGIVIDSTIYRIINDWHWLTPEETRNSNQISFNEYLYSSLYQLIDSGEIFYVVAPGSKLDIPIKKSLAGLIEILKFI